MNLTNYEMPIDTYNYSKASDQDKRKYYEKHVLTEEEKEKTESLRTKMIEFETKVRNKSNISELLNDPYRPEWRIEYFEGIGYISTINADRDIVDVYCYGKTQEEAFLNAIISHELSMSEEYEFYHREQLNLEFSQRFLDGQVSEYDYHGPFFFSELALQDFKKFYGENIPEEIINHYEKHVNRIYKENYKYDVKENRFIKQEKVKQKTI